MRVVGLLLASALAACAPSAADAPISDQWRSIAITATPIELGAEQVGSLRFRGGLHLTADQDVQFGGLSGLEVLDGDRLVAVTDAGAWIEAQLTLDESGSLIGLVNARTAFVRDENGDVFADKESGDSEGLTQLPDGRFAVSFEQTQTIRIYDLNRDGPFGAARLGPALAGAQRLPKNVGLEALAATADGAVLVGAEGGGRARTPLWVASLDASSGVSSQARYRPRRGYSLTALDRLPDGGFVAVERFYAPALPLRVRITRFGDDALEREVVEAEELALLTPPLAVDNFEGVAAVRNADSSTRLYVVSDDNFSERQRTLLLAFDIETE